VATAERPGDDTSILRLVDDARCGDEAAWNELVSRFTPLIINVGLRLRLSAPEVEDVAQTVWLRLVEHLADLREPAGLPGWLVTTSHREGLRLISARRRTIARDPLDLDWQLPAQGPQPDVADPARELLVAERHEAVLLAFADLPARQRNLLLLLTLDPPLTYAEISARTGIPIGSIGPTRGRAVERLRAAVAFRDYLELPDAAPAGRAGRLRQQDGTPDPAQTPGTDAFSSDGR